jgi:hypothetical protein
MNVLPFIFDICALISITLLIFSSRKIILSIRGLISNQERLYGQLGVHENKMESLTRAAENQQEVLRRLLTQLEGQLIQRQGEGTGEQPMGYGVYGIGQPAQPRPIAEQMSRQGGTLSEFLLHQQRMTPPPSQQEVLSQTHQQVRQGHQEMLSQLQRQAPSEPQEPETPKTVFDHVKEDHNP